MALAGDMEPRATWKLVADALGGKVSNEWRDARAVRLDGPRAGDASLEALLASGCLDHIETLHLTGAGFSARSVSLALTLPSLATLRLERVAALAVNAPSTSKLRNLELFDCSVGTCAAILRAAEGLGAVDVESFEDSHDLRPVWESLADHRLVSLRLAHTPCTSAELARALAGSETSLGALMLESTTGLDGDEFLAGRPWTGLRSVAWQRSTIARLGQHLPSTIISLSLRETAVTSLELDEQRLPSLSVLDCVQSTVSDALVTRINLRSLTRLGLGASQVAVRTVAALSEIHGSSLRSLELGAGFDRRQGQDAGSRCVDAVPAGLDTLTIGKGWELHDELFLDLLRGDRVDGLRELTVHRMRLGNPDLGGRFSPGLRRLELVSSPGFIEGLGHGDQPLALTRLALDDVEVREDELVSLLSGCKHLVSLRLQRLRGVHRDGLAAVLAQVGERLEQLELRQFAIDGDYGDALLASRYPQLADLHLDEEMVSARGFRHVIEVETTPALERLSLDAALTDDQWLGVAERAPSALHWIAGYCTGRADSVLEILQDETSGVSAAWFHLGGQVD